MNIVTVPECIPLFYNCRDCGVELLPVRNVNGEWDAFKLGKLPQPEQKPEETHWTQTIDDGLGHYWNATCPKCEQPTMYVVRPGVARCSECDG